MEHDLPTKISADTGNRPGSSNAANITVVNDVVVVIAASTRLDRRLGYELQKAVRNRRPIEMIKDMVKNGADYNVQNEYGNGALHWASYTGDLEMTKYIVSLGVDLEAANRLGVTPLLMCKNVEVLEYLVSVGANLYAKSWDSGDTLAHLVAHDSQKEQFHQMADALINKLGAGQLFAVKSKKGYTPLEYRLHLRGELTPGAVELILGVPELDLNNPANNASKMLWKAVEGGYGEEIIKAMVSCNLDYKRTNEHGENLLHPAVKGNDVEVVQYLISAGLDVNQKDQLGHSPLQILAKNGNRTKAQKQMMKHLVAAGGKKPSSCIVS